ncbi:MAG TPA: SRPBCC family protein [Kofleriaceae bacterium]
MYRFERTQRVPRPRADVFSFFADAANLEVLSPAFLHFKILTPLPIAMHAGALIDYKIKLYGVSMTWQTLIETWEPDARFVDTQVSGPYKAWHHEHRFVDVPGGCEIQDRVDYDVPLGAFGKLGVPIVRRTIDKIFEFRRAEIEKRFS